MPKLKVNAEPRVQGGRGRACLKPGVAITVVLAIFAWVTLDQYRSGANLTKFYLRLDDSVAGETTGNPYTVTTYSAIGTSLTLDPVPDGVWQFTDQGHRPVTHVEIQTAGPADALADLLIDISLQTSAPRHFERLDERFITRGEGWISIDLPAKGSWLFPRYHEVATWRGDATFLLQSVTATLFWLGWLFLAGVAWTCFRSWKNAGQPGDRPKSRWCARSALPFLAILALTFGLRVISLPWGVTVEGMPVQYHPDESQVWPVTYHFPEHYLKSSSYTYGTALQNALGLVLYPAKFLYFGGEAVTFEQDPGWRQVTLIAFRLLNILLATASVALAMKLMFQWAGSWPAWLTGSLLAVAFYHCMNASFATMDVPMSLGVLGVICWAGRFSESNRPTDAAILGAIIGLTASMKMTGILTLAIPATMLAVRWLERWHASPPSRADWIRLAQNLLLTGTTILAVMAMASPQLFLRFNDYQEFMLDQKTVWHRDAENVLLEPARRWWHELTVANSLPLVAMAIAGLLVNEFHRRMLPRAVSWSLLAFLLLNYAFWQANITARSTIPLTPIICFYAATLLATLIMGQRKATRALGFLSASAVIVFGAWLCLRGLAYRANDTRTLASQYAMEHIPPDSRIAWLSTGGDFTAPPWNYPAAHTHPYGPASSQQHHDYLFVNEGELKQLQRTLESGLLDETYRLSPEAAHQHQYRHLPPPGTFRLIERLTNRDSDYELVQQWSVDDWMKPEFASPATLLYHFRPESGGVLKPGAP